MAFKMTHRHQPTLFPRSIEDYIPENSRARVYDAFVDALDFKKLGIRLTPNSNGGAYEYYPKDLLKILIYGPSYGFSSSRKLERACHDNVLFMWIMGGERPDYRTIARFRVKYKEAIKKVLKQCIRMCIEMDLVEGNVLFVDGSKFRANASMDNSWTKEKCEKRIKKIEARIDELVEKGIQEDIDEKGQGSLITIKEDIKDKKKLIDKIKGILEDLEEGKQKKINSTDKDCVNGKSRQGTHAVYNVQSTVDEKNGLIVNAECVRQGNDYNQLSGQVEQATEIIGNKPQSVVADSGYSSIEDLEKIDEEVNVVVPSRRQAQEEKGIKEIGRFDRSRFKYHEQEDEYECPAGHRLTYRGNGSGKYHRTYRIRGGICRGCQYFQSCTRSNKMGRKIIRLNNEKYKQYLENNYLKPKNQEIYALRKQRVEHPFGYLKKNLGAGQFLLRGRKKVNAEISILATCFNLTRMMNILGIQRLLSKFATI